MRSCISGSGKKITLLSQTGGGLSKSTRFNGGMVVLFFKKYFSIFKSAKYPKIGIETDNSTIDPPPP